MGSNGENIIVGRPSGRRCGTKQQHNVLLNDVAFKNLRGFVNTVLA